MAGNAGSDYIVDRLPVVNEQIRFLAKRAKALGILKAYLEALKTAVVQLARDPLEWGDPLHRTQHPGGVACHRLYSPIGVHYVVYTIEKRVIIQAIRLIENTDVPPAYDL
jgi:hypothetical protein